MKPSGMELLATVLFGLAVLHTFASGPLARLAHHHPEGSGRHKLLHLLAEIEVVFAIWAGIFAVALTAFWGPGAAVAHLESVNFTEPLFVFAIMAVAGTRPILVFANDLIRIVAHGVSRVTRLPASMAYYFVLLLVGPLLGSFITEPAAMTVTALLARRHFLTEGRSRRFLYSTLGTLFVNVSIGGVLTHFAAPPVLMVARTWEWDTPFMLAHFGWKAAIATTAAAALATVINRRELEPLPAQGENLTERVDSPLWVIAAHLLFLGLVVLTAHHPKVFLPIFVFFLGFAMLTARYQDRLKLKESLLVAVFLGGLVVLGSLQAWWLAPIIQSLSPFPLFAGATALTAITDNAALTFLGAQVPGILPDYQYALVAGAVTGGGLTVIANAPNPAGVAILRDRFGESGISPLGLLAGALPPTLIAFAMFWGFR